jgi:hypothetical protein
MAVALIELTAGVHDPYSAGRPPKAATRDLPRCLHIRKTHSDTLVACGPRCAPYREPSVASTHSPALTRRPHGMLIPSPQLSDDPYNPEWPLNAVTRHLLRHLPFAARIPTRHRTCRLRRGTPHPTRAPKLQHQTQ